MASLKGAPRKLFNSRFSVPGIGVTPIDSDDSDVIILL